MFNLLIVLFKMGCCPNGRAAIREPSTQLPRTNLVEPPTTLPQQNLTEEERRSILRFIPAKSTGQGIKKTQAYITHLNKEQLARFREEFWGYILNRNQN